MNLINWQREVSEHQVHTLRALSAMHGVNLAICIFGRQHTARARQGWKPPSLEGLSVRKLFGAKGWLAAFITLWRAPKDCIHIFNTMWGTKRLFPLFVFSVILRRRTWLMSEPYSPINLGYLRDEPAVTSIFKNLLRRACYTVAGRVFGRYVDGIYVISRLAYTQFAGIGFRRERLFPFGYFVAADQKDRNSINFRLPFEVVFVGNIINRKGLDIAAQAVERMNESGLRVRLSVYGPGGASGYLGYRNVTYRGRIGFGETVDVIQKYSALIVPSRYDGWGVVVNEALLAGVPVIASRETGASALIDHSGAGWVYENGVDGLCLTLMRIIESSEQWQYARNAALQFRSRLSPSVAASYAVDCFTHIYNSGPRPECPWYAVDSQT
jgi:glycosyltransferase involved in cell wall biosynthesis